MQQTKFEMDDLKAEKITTEKTGMRFCVCVCVSVTMIMTLICMMR